MTNNTKNVWDQMVLFNQLTLSNILNGQEDLGTPELRAAVASPTNKYKENAICFLKCNAEELACLPDSQGIQVMVNVCTLLDYYLIRIVQVSDREIVWFNIQRRMSDMKYNKAK